MTRTTDSPAPCASPRLSDTRAPGLSAFLLAVTLGLIAGCASVPRIPEPLRPPKAEAAGIETLVDSVDAEHRRPRIEEGPKSGSRPPRVDAHPPQQAVPEVPRKKPVSVVLDGVPLGTFINVLFGMELGFGLQLDQAVLGRPDLVSLRLTEAQAPERVYSIGVEVLKNYGVSVRDLGGILYFAPANAQQGGAAPALIATRSLPDVPSGQRTVHVAMPLSVSQPGRIAAHLRSLFGNQSVTVTELVEDNALLIAGPGDGVQAAMEAVLTLDRSALVEKRSLRINPLYMPADLLAKELREILTAQGISVRGPGTGGAVAFVPVASANALIVFSESEEALQTVAQWAERLDQPSEQGTGGGVYMYAARHTTVSTLVPVLEAMIGAGNTSAAAAAGGNGQAASPARATAVGGISGQLAVDPVRNVIVYQGDPQRWRAIQGVLARLDQPARQVVIEVTIAEVTLTDEFSHGVEWALRNVSTQGMSGPLTALAGGAPNAAGVVWRALSSSGQVSAVLNLFAKDNRVTILSTPRLLVKSGDSASIDVGTEVPIITSQATAADLPNSGGDRSSILQSIQYRKTGVLLEIEAVVHSGSRVDLKVSQEVSEAAPTDTSDISSPSIFSRKLQTSLSLSDGESTLLGGLISSSRTDGKTKVPLLGDLPLVGLAFQNRRREGTRTELLMLITPYVLEDASQSRAITDAIRQQFGDSVRRFPAIRRALKGPVDPKPSDGEPASTEQPVLPPARATDDGQSPGGEADDGAPVGTPPAEGGNAVTKVRFP